MNGYITLENINFSYKKTGFRIEDLSFGLNPGETTMLAGRNGCGKTTVSKLIMNILEPDSGGVCIGGKSTTKMPLADIANDVGYLFQQPDRQLFNRTALEEVTFSLIQKGWDEEASAEKAKELLARFGLEDKEAAYPLKLSRGEKQRLALAAVMVMEPKYYILDEPSSGLDAENKQTLIDLLNSLRLEGAGLLIITHDKELVGSLAERIITMDEGKVISDEKA